jgi:signal transduction histidine kinase/CheY-like chemotaxis protein
MDGPGRSDGGLLSLRQDTLQVLLLGATALAWLWFALADLWPGYLGLGWPFSLALAALAAVCWRLRLRHPAAAARLFTLGAFGCVALLLLHPGEGAFGPYLFVAVVLIAGVLHRWRVAFALAGAAALAIVALPGAAGAEPIPTPLAAGALFLIGVAALTSWATTRSLYTTLHWVWDYSEQAERNLAEARTYQAELANALRQLQQANYRLERANHSLDWARAEAEEARKLKAQFAANVSHELRTPINLIVGFGDLMMSHPEAYGSTPLPKGYLTDLALLHRSARHLQGLIDDILDLSQVDAGEMPVVKDLTEVDAILHESVATARPLLERKGLRVGVEIAEGLPLLYLDRVRIRQVVLNLLSNAARFTDRGGVTVRACRHDGHVTVEVADTGTGIEPNDLRRLFEPYGQATAAEARRGGTGLGLYIARRFVELHGGRIWATSEGRARGSTFGFTLPLQLTDDHLTVGRGGSGPSPWRLAGDAPAATVVVVDDDPAVVSLFQRHLSSYRVVGVPSRAEALAAAGDLRAHAVIVDLASAGSLADWHDEWSAIAARERLRVLGCPMPSARRVARALGLADYLVKPVTRETLLETVRSVGGWVRTILVIDDDPGMVRLVSRMLRTAPGRYRLLRAYGGREGLEVMRRSRPDLVLLDLMMPEVDGLGVLETMRADPALRDVPVVALSAHSAAEAISPSTGRSLVLVAEATQSVSGLLRSLQMVLDGLPPARAETQPAAQASQAAPLGSAAS